MLPLLVAGLLASAQPAGRPAAAPQIHMARVIDGHLVFQQTVYQAVFEEVVEKVVVNGKEQLVSRKRQVLVPVMRESRLALKEMVLREVGGKKLDVKELTKRLVKPAPVVVSSDGKEIDAAFLKLFQKDTILIVPAPSPEPAPPKRP